jgi:membrane associated rhomboid family serine protease
MTPWVRRLIIANGAMFLVTWVYPVLPSDQLMFMPALLLRRPWTIVTYMFLHAGFMHLALNMLWLYICGPRLEQRLGSRQFLLLYLVSGIVGGLLSFTTPYARIVGASGAVFGVLFGCARYWPRDRIYLFGVLPIEMMTLVVIMTLLALFGGFTGARDGVAHFAHLGGFLGGFVFLKWWELRSPAARFRRKAATDRRPSSGVMNRADVKRWAEINRDNMHPVNREELDRILDKINAEGSDKLAPEEREFLERFSAL